MLYLALAIVCGTTYSILFKLFACKGLDSLQAIAFNYLTAFGLGVIVGGVSENGIVLPASVGSWVVAVVLGLTFAGAFVLMARSTERSGVTLTTVASRVSLVIPVVCSHLLFPECDTPRWGAIAVILLALVLMFVPPKGKRDEVMQPVRTHRKVPMVLYPLGVWLLFGINNFGLKVAQTELISPQESAMFSAVIFLFATMFSAVWWQTKGGDRRRLELRSALGGVALGLANFFVTWGMLRGLAQVPASTFFPTYHTTIVALVALVGTMVFKERLSPVQWSGVGVGVIGIVMFFV